ncbi:MAG: excinuclease ABC subunit UvrC, partial [Clostridia bacterium]|nr:excinuclease ABC subunit UvrC [Clostridia bacterium]
MVNAEYAEHLREKALGLPLTPGVYIMKDKNGKVIYVGKSRKLKNRVSQYFHENDFKSAKTDAMTFFVADFDYILCDTEIEALSLENSLIKLYKPRYNIKLKDDRSYPYIKATVNSEYPEFSMTRKRDSDKAVYFGPYTGTSTVFSIISAIQKTFGLPSCKNHFPKDKGKIPNCIYQQMGCIAPCKDYVTSEQYKLAFNDALDFLNGNTKSVIENLESKMYKASETLAFEAAAKYRDRIDAITKLSEKQKVVESPDIERDIIAWQDTENIPSVCIFYIRNGRLIESELFFFDANEIFDSSALLTFTCDFYNKRDYVPKEITISHGITDEDIELLQNYLSEKSKRKVSVRIPQRGNAKKLSDLAKQNATQRAVEKYTENKKSEKSLERLAVLARLECIPERIEAFDISNYGSEHIIAGMVCFESAKPKKSDYRLFNIRTTDTQDDYASMREAFQRRISHQDTLPLPDLFLVDGGEQHLSVVLNVLDENHINVPVLGMVKDDHHKTRALIDRNGEISISHEQGVFSLIYSIQEEVHRYTVGHMTNQKRKTVKKSSLCNINGIGDAKAKMLLKQFGGLSSIKNATIEELNLGETAYGNA